MIKSTPTFVPAIPPPGNSQPETNRVLHALKEATEVGLGRRGDPLDRFVTLRDLTLSGIGQVGGGRGGSLTAGGGNGQQVNVDVPGTLNGLPDNTPPNYGTGDYTPPPVVTGLTMVPMTTTGMMIYWDAPNYGNHAYTEIYLVSAAAFDAVGATATEQNFIALSTAAFSQNTPCTGTTGANPNKFFRLKPAGSSVVVSLSVNDIGGGTSLAQLVNPGTWYCFARFVSLAQVAGPFGPPGQPGAAGQPSIDPVAVLDLMTKGVVASNVYTDLTAFIGTNPLVLAQIAAGGGIAGTTGATNGIFNNVINNTNTLSKLYTVQAATTLPDGNIVAAGFGLGITVDATTGSASSLFAVNADQFAIMGGGGTYSPLSGFQSSSSTIGTFTVKNGNKFPDISSAFASWNQAIPIGNPPIIVIKSSAAMVNGVQTDPFDNVEATVTGILGNKITCTINTPSGNSTPNTWPSFISSVPKYICLATNIPFIVDTATQTVGIRGRLVVDGLIRATKGDFTTLTANSAFINSLRANVINANLVCGQSIIAGAGIDPNIVVNGSIDTNALANVDAWIVKLSTPTAGGYPFQIYNPKRSGGVFEGAGTLLSLYGGDPRNNTLPHLYLNGDLNCGGGACFNLVQGGAVALGKKSLDGIAYTYWCGADTDYGTTAQQMENNGFFWIRAATIPEQAADPFHRTARAGFNTSVFLGGDPLTIPSGSGSITVVPPRAGGNANVFASAVVTTIHDTEQTSNRTTISAQLWLVPSGYAGPGPGGQGRQPVAYQSGLGTNVGFFGAVDPPPAIPGGYLISGSQYDFKGTDSNNFALQGSVSVPPGVYTVFVQLCLKPSDRSGPISAYQANFFSMQVQR